DPVPALAWYLMLANACWVIAYDTAYAMADRPDDLRAGIRSTAILFGRFDWLAILLLEIVMLGILAAIGHTLQLSWPYWFSLLGAAGLFLYQQSLLDGDRDRAFRAFLHSNWVGLWIFWGLVASLGHA
ncbi:MAG: UbiA family prenyltransferase, partial [Candidatus Igneacidithiobacillus chanchocoensis]